MTVVLRVLVTGANGLVGTALCDLLERRGQPVRAAFRHTSCDAVRVDPVVVGDLHEATDWSAALAGCDVVVHLAARVHVMNDDVPDPVAAFRRVNVDATLNLANQALLAGVRRLIYISTVKVHGEHTAPDRPFRASDPLRPADPYSQSKAEAEAALAALSSQSGLEIVFIRPPLVYGPGVKANFALLLQSIRRGRLLPFGAVTANRRSLVACDNLADLISTCVSHPSAAGQAFLVSDGEDVSTAELVRRIAKIWQRPVRLISLPAWLLSVAAILLGRRNMARRLFESLQVDIQPTCETLGWLPPFTLDQALNAMKMKDDEKGI